MNTLSVDHRDPLFPRGPGLGLRALSLLIICGTLIYFDFRTPKLESLRSTLALALSPVLWVASLPEHLTDAGDYLDSRDQLAAENKRLHDRQFQLEAKLQKFEALEAENRRIRELLASAKNLQENVLITEIVAVNQDPYRHQITLNKGARDRVYRGQALVDASGVMGQIIQVNPTTSVALLITDPDHGIPVEINRTGLQTIALGVGDGQALRLPFLPGNADIQKGDLLVSSALGGRFPAGYPVAQVFEIKHNPGEHFAEALAYPTARLNQGRQALLVWSEDHTDDAETIVSVPGPAAAETEVKKPATMPKPTVTPAPAAAKPTKP
ncbi:MAG: mreC [Hydrocarboniphaga sp.]|uniref:rod shape-determining protein MreC n=1 Tax=Hydrocarboniphaga sp. TaxID=2033016 RepID=UPI002611323D|nr:rod shape-determining protein MreC [Hydrocarboniphaga sp.]MDB5970975.1 mreC [Hydrocarboniphaga sp.]